MCNIGIGVNPHESILRSYSGKNTVECFRVFPEYQVQDADTKRNVLNELKKWIKSEEAQLDNIVENQDSSQQPQPKTAKVD